jgi:hypothetical protein
MTRQVAGGYLGARYIPLLYMTIQRGAVRYKYYTERSYKVQILYDTLQSGAVRYRILQGSIVHNHTEQSCEVQVLYYTEQSCKVQVLYSTERSYKVQVLYHTEQSCKVQDTCSTLDSTQL